MSSFVIEKEQYIRAAGILAGIAEESARYSHKLWIYDYTTNRNMIAEDYHRVFTDMYEKNALSVMEQYDDETRESDPDEYTDVFKEYMQKGRAYVMRSDVKKVIWPLNKFFNSCKYQTEKEEYNWHMQLVFGRIITALVDYTTPASCHCWGDLDEI